MTANPLVGTWSLVSFAVHDDDGSVAYPFSRDVTGFITYTADGHMSVQFGRSYRTALSLNDWLAAPDDEIAAAARDYFAYCGTYELQDDTVVHQLQLSLMPNWIGGTLLRHIALAGDTVTLTTRPTLIAGRNQVGVLVWRRV